MRIIGGAARGRRLAAPRDRSIRPTSDKVKEALFSILASSFGTMESCRVLDIFAGTGALGIEALSRGAQKAVFIDSSREAIRLIQHNLLLAGFGERAEIVSRDVFAGLRHEENAGNLFDLVFLDPPYASELGRQVLTTLEASPLINGDSVVVAEFSSRDPLPEAFGRLRQYSRRVYGDTAVAFLRLDTTG